MRAELLYHNNYRLSNEKSSASGKSEGNINVWTPWSQRKIHSHPLIISNNDTRKCDKNKK